MIRTFNGFDVQIEYSIRRVTARITRLARDAKQLSHVTEYSICTEQPL